MFKGTLTAAGLGNATVSLAADKMVIDDGAGGTIKTTSLADYATAIAGAGITATAGVLSTEAQAVNAIGDGTALLEEGTNYLSASLTANRTYRTPVNPTVGDIIRVKANALGAYIMTVSASGLHQIDGARTFDLESDYAAATLVYVETGKWRIF